MAFSCSIMALSTRLGASVVSAPSHSEALSRESAIRECLSLFWLSGELQSHQPQEMGLKSLQIPRRRVGCASKLHSARCLTWAQTSETEGTSLPRLIMTPSLPISYSL